MMCLFVCLVGCRVFTYVDAQKIVVESKCKEKVDSLCLSPSPPCSSASSCEVMEEDPMAMSCYVDLSLPSLEGQGGNSVSSPLAQLHKTSPDGPPSPPLISFRNVTFSYPSRPQHSSLRSLNVNIFNQSLTAIAGTSGAGKSSMLALMCALYKPVSGELNIAGKIMSTCSDDDIKDLRKKVRVRASLICLQ